MKNKNDLYLVLILILIGAYVNLIKSMDESDSVLRPCSMVEKSKNKAFFVQDFNNNSIVPVIVGVPSRLVFKMLRDSEKYHREMSSQSFFSGDCFGFRGCTVSNQTLFSDDLEKTLKLEVDKR